MEQMRLRVSDKKFDDLCQHIYETYGVEPFIQYSSCTMMPGDNLKFRKGSRALCTVYPSDGGFCAMVSIGRKQQDAFDQIFGTLTDQVQAVYRQASPMQGARWLMIDVTDEAVLEDVKTLIALRMKYK